MKSDISALNHQASSNRIGPLITCVDVRGRGRILGSTITRSRTGCKDCADQCFGYSCQHCSACGPQTISKVTAQNHSNRETQFGYTRGHGVAEAGFK